MKRIITLLLAVAMLTGCGTTSASLVTKQMVQVTPEPVDEKPYLSITETYYIDDDNENCESRAIIYDTKEVKEIGTVPYKSSYPLTCYSNEDEYIYYIRDAGKRYQIYRNEEQPRLYKNDLCMYNYLSKCGEKYFSLAIQSRHSCMNPFVLNSDFGEYKRIIDDPKDDMFCWAVGVDYKNHTIYFSEYSDNENRAAIQGDEPSNATIYSYNVDTGQVSKVLNEKIYIAGIAAQDGILYISEAENYQMENQWITKYDMLTGQSEKIDIGVQFGTSAYMEIVDDVLYYLANGDEGRGIYAYNFDTKETKQILRQNDDEFINGFSLNY